MSESNVIDKEEYFLKKQLHTRCLRATVEILENKGQPLKPRGPRFASEIEGMKHRVAELKLQLGFNLTLEDKVLLAKYKPPEE